MKMLKRWISVCLVILLLAGVAFDHSSLIGSTVEAAGLEETDGAEPAETPDASEETTDVPSLLSEGDGSDTPAPEAQTVTNTETETEAPAEKTETKQEESTEPEKQTVTNTDTETKAPAKKTETKQEESTEPEKQAVTNKDNETKEPVTKTSDDVSKESVQPSAFKGKYEDDSIIINVSAEPGVVPEGAKLSVTPIEKTEITNDMTAEEKAEAEKINDQYDLTEKKLTEDSEKNEETMEGFLAYDISFLVNGEEVEPTGDVKVTMDFKEAAIPEGVSEDSEVSVKHLKEDETAEDGVIVEDMDSKSNIQTTAQAEVEKVELTAESFSTFTITWSGQRFKKDVGITFIDTSGNIIAVANENQLNLTLGTEDEFDTSDITSDGSRRQYYKITGTNGKTYTFVKALNIWGDPKTDAGSEFTRLRIEDRRLQWYMVEGGVNQWQNSDEQDKFYFVYASEDSRPQTVPTNSENIEINLYNYNKNINSGSLYRNGFGFYSSQAGKDGASSYTGDFTNSNKDSPAGNQGRLANIVKKNLRNGIPVLDTQNGISMESLFSSGNTTGKTPYTNLSGLFQLDANGYYTYDSLENGAVLDGNEIKVYDTIVTPDFADYGNFLPFNSEWVNKTTSGVPYKFSSRSEMDLWFGMNIGLNFYQPESGKINGQDMIFEFSGDDDVWVFIDGVLVLDLGGIHDRLDGTINFATGDVDAAGTPTTLRKCYAAAYREAHPSANNSEVRNYLDGIFDDSGKFLNYSDHRLEFFYLERGGGAANCRLRFNMPTLPNDGITVSKLIDNYDEGAYTDVEFKFELYLDKDGNGQVNDSEKVTAADTFYSTYTVKEIGSTGPGETRTLGEDGIFTLKHGEMATFSNIQVTTKYKVKEVGLSSKEYDDIEITSGVTDQTGDVNLTDSTDHSGYAESKILEVGSNIQVIFHNQCNPTNMKQLYIYKNLAGADTSTDTYRVQVIVGGAPYQGEYLLGTSAGFGSQETTKDGWISFSAGQVITVLGNVTSEDGNRTGFPSGTTFKVIEDVEILNKDTYGTPSYSIKDGTATVTDTENSAAGVFILDSNAEVTVTNNLKGNPDTPYIEIQKTFSGLDASEIPEGFQIELYDSQDDQQPIKTLNLNDATFLGDLTYVWRCNDLDPGTYYVKENGEEVQGYTVTITMNRETIESSSEKIEIATQSPVFTASNVHQINSNSETEFSFDENNFIAASLKDQTIFVWTIDTLSIGERQAILEVINQEGSGNLAGKATLDNTNFYSTTDRLEEGIVVGDGAIYVKDGILSFTRTSQWQHVIAGLYNVTESVNAEIEVVNTYKAATMDVDLKKFMTDFETPLNGAKFSLYSGTMDESQRKITWSDDPMKNKESFEVKNDEFIELRGLQSGYYKLVETEAPQGYVKLAQPIIFKVDTVEKKITLIDENGTELTTHEMWELEGNDCIKIKNNILYDLPQSGGPGIYWYTIGGMLLMMAGSLILYKNKRREVLERK